MSIPARVAFVATLVLAIMFLTAGCTDEPPCAEGHTDLIPITQVGPNGAVSVNLMPVFTCDRYETPDDQKVNV